MYKYYVTCKPLWLRFDDGRSKITTVGPNSRNWVNVSRRGPFHKGTSAKEAKEATWGQNIM